MQTTISELFIENYGSQFNLSILHFRSSLIQQNSICLEQFSRSLVNTSVKISMSGDSRCETVIQRIYFTNTDFKMR